MSEDAEEISAEGAAFWRRVYAKVTAAADAAITATFGQAWRGGRFQWPYLLPGHGFELQQTGVQNFSTSDLTITTDVATAAPINYPIAYDVLTANPRVYAQSYDTDWVATAYPTPGNEHSQITVALARRISRTLTQFGHTGTETIASGADHDDVSVTFPAAFAATPVVTANTDNTLTRLVVLSVSTTGATFRVSYVPTTAAGVVGYSKTGLGDPTGLAEATNYSSSGVSTDDNSDGTDTGDNSDGTDTGAASRSPNTGDQNQDHTHGVPPGTDAGGGTTGGESVGHNHPMDHTHPHNSSGGHHTHPHNSSGGHHTHPIVEPVSGTDVGHTHTLSEPPAGGGHGAGHTHSFTGSAEDAPSDTTFTIHWVAQGGRVVSAASVDVSWLAVGGQAS